MTIRKFRSAAEMNVERWYEPGDPELYRAMAWIWDLGTRSFPRRFRAGVTKFRSIEEMDVAQDAARDADFRALQQRRGGGR